MPNEADIQQKCVNFAENLHANQPLSISLLERGSQDPPLFPGLGRGGRVGQQAAVGRRGRGEQQAPFVEVEDEIHCEEDDVDVSEEEEEEEGDSTENYETEDDEDENQGEEFIKVSHVPTNESMVVFRDLRTRSWLKSPYVDD